MRGMIYIWDAALIKCQKIIELSSLPFQILSNYIVSMDFNQRKLLVLTIAGDAIEIHLNEQNHFKIKANRIASISKINGMQRAMCILN
mmetsp:Transcript_34024/g.33191  ORF Transcript_34024/g.33191 Transcript_34024/m.33191 type:complete len:88 (-) Transcript_34024:2529-2792(-)